MSRYRPHSFVPYLHVLAAIGAIAALGAIGVCAQTGSARQTDERAVLATVERLFDAMRTRDTATMRSLFDGDARLVGMRPRPDGEMALQTLTADQFAAYVARDTRGPWIERMWNPQVRIEGTLATVWAEYDFHFGARFSHCGVDAFQLLKTAERGWVIVSIADTFVRDGCPKRPPRHE